MYVCICNALNDRAVRSALAEGARNAAAVYASRGCRAQCGKCIPLIQQMARDHGSADPAAAPCGPVLVPA